MRNAAERSVNKELAAGLGMALLFLSYVAGPGRPSARPQPADSAQGTYHRARARRAPVLAVCAHVIFATATILFAVLAAIGTG